MSLRADREWWGTARQLASQVRSAFDGTFDGRDYLARHPDVRAAVERGEFRDALHHYEEFGRRERRAHRRALPGYPGVGVALGFGVVREPTPLMTRLTAWTQQVGALIEQVDPGQVASRLRPDAALEVVPPGPEALLGGSPSYFANGTVRLSVPLRRRSARAGYALLRLRLDAQLPRGDARLVVDYGDGARPQVTWVRFRSGRRVRRLVRFDRVPVAVWLEVPGYAGYFRVVSLALRPVAPRFAAARIARRLAHHHPRYLERDVDALTHEVIAPSGEVHQPSWVAYESTFTPPVDHRPYWAWLASVEAPHLAHLDAEAPARVRALRKRPKVSVVVPVHDPSAEHLEACITSILAQSYPNLEVCIADDASSAAHVRPLLERLAASDSRVRLHFRCERGHICAASNDALALASGELVALVDHDDVLPKHALLMAVEAFDAHPDAALVYGDEDKLDLEGHRTSPHFKPDWNPELLLSQNYVGHLVVARTDCVRGVGGFRSGYEGSQDHDLLLRLTEGLRPDQIVHVPWILYHWRESEGSTALSGAAKSYTQLAGERALRDALDRRGMRAEVLAHPLAPNAYRLRALPDTSPPLVSLIVPTRDGGEKLETAVDSILGKTRYSAFELLVIDNGSVEARSHRYFDRIQRDSRVRVLRYDRPFNFSAINNYAVVHARGSLVGLINDDVEVIAPDWLDEMVGWARQQEIGCVGAKLLYPDQRLQHAGVVVGLGGVAGHSHKYLPADEPGYFYRPHLTQAVTAVTAACLLVEKRIYQEVGGLDEERFVIAFNDVDFCLRVQRAGYRNVYAASAVLFHHESATRGAEDTPEKQARFTREVDAMKARWGRTLALDPYYSRHLTLDREDFSITNRPLSA